MFDLNAAEVQAPVTTPVFANPVQGADVSTYLEDFKANDINTKATIGSIIKLLADEAVRNPTDQDAVPALITNCGRTFMAGAAAAFNALVAANTANPPTDNDLVKSAIIANTPNAAHWFVNLTNAAKKKPLTESNVEGFFAALGHVGTKASAVASLLNKLVAFFPDQISVANFRATLMPGIWTTYRNTRVSTGIILKKLLPEFRDLGITVAGDQVELAIEASAAAPWDLNLSLDIPDKYKAYGCIFLEAAGTPIDTWYQGNKARDDLPAVRVRGAKAIFKKYLEIKNDTAAIDEIQTIQDFANVAAFF
jgi:hypothetical protein